MKISSFIKKPIYSALVFFGSLGVLSAGYAGFVTLQSSDADSGKSLTSGMMQAVIGNLADLDTRVTGATTSLASLSGAVSSLQVSAGNLWGTVTGGIGYSGGNVGIGTSTPNSLLHVYKDSGNNAELDLQSVAGTNKHWGIYQNRADESLRFWNNTAGGDSVTVTNGGRVGIGTSAPTQKLHVVGNTLVENGNITIGRTAADYSTLVINNTSGVQVHLNANGNSEGNLRTVTNHPLSFSTNNIERMKIDTAGNVGIGTISPTEKLEVTGNIKTSGGIVGTGFGQVFYSNMPNDMSYGAGWSALGSATSPMPIGTYFYQIYGCAGQNTFTNGASGVFVFASGAWAATPTNYFNDANLSGSCGYFRSGHIQVTTAGSTVQLKISAYTWGATNADNNPGANAMQAIITKIF